MTGREIAGGRRGRNVEIIECGAGGDCGIQLDSHLHIVDGDYKSYIIVTTSCLCTSKKRQNARGTWGRTHFEDEKAGCLEDELERGKRPKDRL